MVFIDRILTFEGHQSRSFDYQGKRFLLRHAWGDYLALSYCWGREDQYKYIFVNGALKRVTVNLWTALCALRKTLNRSKGLLKVWVDALCINQSDNDERNHQVRLMRTIYAGARLVISWLGPEADNSNLAFDHMNQLASVYRNSQSMLEACRRGEPVFTADFIRAFFQLAVRDYWGRLWIVQEIALGDVLLLCGDKVCSWETISLIEKAMGDAGSVSEEFYFWFKEQFKELGRRSTDLNSIMRLDRCRTAMKEQGEMDIMSLMRMGQTVEVTDDRDRVYGLLGLMGPAMSSNIVPDYNMRSMESYAAFTKSFIQTKGSLEILRLAGTGETRKNWSSWIPSFDIRPRANPFEPPGSRAQASQNIPCIVDCSKLDGGIPCEGILFDVVDGVGAPHRREVRHFWSLDTSDLIQHQPSSKNRAYDAQGTVTALWQTLTANRDASGRVAPLEYSELFHLHVDRSRYATVFMEEFVTDNAKFQIFGKCFKDYFNFQANDSDKTTQRAAIEAAKRVRWCLASRKLVITARGYLALAPIGTRRGDIVSILFGCSTPMIVRAGLVHYELIGESYVHGIMDGNAVEEYLHGNQTANIFNLY
jgi:Heterokaryon incompatibility protein (HET)